MAGLRERERAGLLLRDPLRAGEREGERDDLRGERERERLSRRGERLRDGLRELRRPRLRDLLLDLRGERAR